MNKFIFINTKHEKIKTSSFVSLIVFGGLSAILFVLCVGCGGVLNDWDFALEEIQDLERRNLLTTPPDHISSIAKEQIRWGHTSAEIKEYIKGVEASAKQVETSFFMCIFLFFLSTIAWIYCRRKLNHPQ